MCQNCNSHDHATEDCGKGAVDPLVKRQTYSLDEIRKRNETSVGPTVAQVDWLIAEVERLADEQRKTLAEFFDYTHETSKLRDELNNTQAATGTRRR